MPITIKEIKITSLTVAKDAEGIDKISAHYQLIASNDRVLAKESLTSGDGYGESKFVPSPATTKALRDAVAAYKSDVEMSLGIETT